MAQSHTREVYADGSIVYSNLFNDIGVPLLGNRKSIEARVITHYWDGTPMTDDKVDNKLYSKIGNEYIEYLFPFWGENFLEKDTMGQMRAMEPWEIVLLRRGYWKGVRLNGYYAKNDTPASIEYLLSETSDADDGGSVIEVGDIKLEHVFVGEIDVKYYGVTGKDDQDPYFILEKVFLKARTYKLNIRHPQGIYNVVNRNFPYRNPVIDNGLLDCGGIKIYGEGRGTIFKTTSENGADVLQLNSVSNLRIENISITADINTYDHAGSNGVSITNGFDNVEIVNVHCFDLPSVPYPDPLLNYLDGGKAFTIQSSKGNTNKHGRLYIRGTAENVGYGYGHDGFCEDIYNQQELNIDAKVNVVRSFKGVAISFGGPESSFDANSKSLNYKLYVKSVNSQWDITMNRVFGGQFDFETWSDLTKEELKTNPLTGQPWLTSRNITYVGHLTPVKNCKVNISGYKFECEQFGAIGAVGSLLEPLYDGSTRMSDININVSGNITTPIAVNTNGQSKNVEHCRIHFKNTTTVPDTLYNISKNNSLTLNGIPYTPKQAVQGLYFRRTISEIDTQRLELDTNGYLELKGQRLGSLAGIPLWKILGWNGTTDIERFVFLNNGTLQINNPDGARINITSGITAPEGVLGGVSGDLHIRVGVSGGTRIPGSLWFKQTESGNTGWVRLDNVIASLTIAGLVKKAAAQANISQADLVAIATADGSDAATTQVLANAIKAWINTNLVPLVNATKASQNTELTNQRTAEQQAP